MRKLFKLSHWSYLGFYSTRKCISVCFSQNSFRQNDFMHFRYIDKCTQKEDLAIQRNAILLLAICLTSDTANSKMNTFKSGANCNRVQNRKVSLSD